MLIGWYNISMSTTQQFSRRKPRLIIHDEVREALSAKNMTMVKLSVELDVSRNWLYQALQGVYPFSEERIAKLNQILGTSFSLPE